LRDHYGEIQARGAEVIAIGMGIPEMAKDFRDKRKIPFPLLIDRERISYKSLSLKRGNANEVYGPAVVARGSLKFLKNLQGLPPKETDRMQLGAVAVVDKGGDILFIHRSKTAADNFPVAQVIEALP
jgi:hypothetical protein